MKSISDLNITIVGIGLIGGSYAKAIRKNININKLWAIDINIDSLNEAVSTGVIDDGYVAPQFPLENSDLVILCTYPNITIDFLKNNMKHFKKNALITDTIGMKNKIVSEVLSIKRDDLEFIGGHPMSGRESIGYSCSDDSIFKNAQYILTPDKNTSASSLNLLKQIITGIGFSEIIEMSPQKHDAKVAFTSQLPHVIACTLMNNSELNDDLQCVGGSFKDATRVADINSELWSELIFENKYNILNVLNDFIVDITNIYDIIKSDDKNSLISFLNKSSIRRKEMNI
nr:prephenate dehydrogenase [Sedimentibacter sp.]